MADTTTAPVTPTSSSAALSAPAAPTTPVAPVAPSVAPTTETVNPGSWTAGFNDDLKGYVGNKGFKDPAALADAYRNLEKLQGVPQDRIMKLPESFYDDKGNLTVDGRSIYERLGAPKDPKDYGLEAPKEGGDAKRLENFVKAAHEMGLTKAQAQRLAAADGEYAAAFMTQMKEAKEGAFRDQETVVRKEWGAAYDNNRNIAAEGARKMGMDAQKIDALSSVLGHAETMKLLLNIGKSTGEASFVSGRQPGAPLEPANAKTRISELIQDREFGARLERGETDAKATWERLHQQAYPGQMAI